MQQKLVNSQTTERYTIKIDNKGYNYLYIILSISIIYISIYLHLITYAFTIHTYALNK